MKNVFKSSNCLNFDKGSNRWIFVDDHEVGSYRTHHTKGELEAGGLGDVFDNPMFEVEEV